MADTTPATTPMIPPVSSPPLPPPLPEVGPEGWVLPPPAVPAAVLDVEGCRLVVAAVSSGVTMSSVGVVAELLVVGTVAYDFTYVTTSVT